MGRGNYQAPTGGQVDSLSQPMLIQHVFSSTSRVRVARGTSTEAVAPALKKLTAMGKRQIERVVPRGTA